MTLGGFHGAIFDMDGVLIDTLAIHERSWFAVGKERGLYIDHDLFQQGNGLTSVAHATRVLKWTSSLEEAQEIANAKEAAYVQFISKEGVAPIPGVIAFLSRLRELGIPCAVGTSAPRSNLDRALKATGLEGFFSAFITSENVKEGKPDPEVFLKAAQELQIPPIQCVVFEDAANGVTAAKRAGMGVIALTTTHPRDELLGADLIVDGFAELDPQVLFKGL